MRLLRQEVLHFFVLGVGIQSDAFAGQADPRQPVLPVGIFAIDFIQRKLN